MAASPTTRTAGGVRGMAVALVALAFVNLAAGRASQATGATGARLSGPPRARDDKAEERADDDLLAPLAHYLLPGTTYARLERANDRPLLELLERVGPDMKPASGFKDPANVTLELAARAWTRMREHAQRVAAGRLDLLWPSVERALVDANASGPCQGAARRTAQAARRLEAWAIKMLNSWGSFPPAGLFEGTLGDVGSFHGCLSVRPPTDGAIKHAHYCTLSYRPVLASRRDYELVVRREPRELLELFGPEDAFAELAQKSQYNHYVYLKLGACLPIECSPLDAQRIARLLGRRAILLSGPVKCHSRRADDYEQVERAPGVKLELSTRDLNGGVYIWKPHVSRAQVVALGCLGALVCLVLSLTLVDVVASWRRDVLGLAAAELPLGALEPPAAGAKRSGASVELDLNNNSNSNNDDDDDGSSESHTSNHHNKGHRKQVADGDNNNNNNNNNNSDNNDNQEEDAERETLARLRGARELAPVGPFAQFARDFSLVRNAREFFDVAERRHAPPNGDILCMNGLRCVTMSWIILAHTIQYNDWAAFARIYEVESQLDSLLNQPIFNASYLVDTFFLMSGLLTSYSVFRSRGRARPFGELLGAFSWRAYLVGRYLRLTPQILLVSLLFIVLPLAQPDGGPHWHSMTGEYAENCAANWWVNLLHIQAFYKPDEMCNFVCWWISVDMAYHLLALLVMLVALRLGAGALLKLCAALALANALAQAARHYELELPPNMLSTIPQTGAMWTHMTLGYFWTPIAHLLPFLLGLALGLGLARHSAQLTRFALAGRRAPAGWLACGALLSLVLFGTRPWVLGEVAYSRLGSTAWALLAQAAWALALGWTIVACQLGRGGALDAALSCRLFRVLGRASYLVYLSHFLVLFAFFGSQNLLLEPTRAMILYLILGNVCLSTLLGCLLCVAFEMPWLKVQRRIMRYVS